jgi:transcriptional regulator with XRE-family HTH domain
VGVDRCQINATCAFGEAILNILRFSKLLIEKRGERGVREFARELNISPTTLSRIERGKLPDLETFGKLCSALKIDPAEILEVEEFEKSKPMIPTVGTTALHCRVDANYTVEAARDLADLILAAEEFAKQNA